MAPQNRFQQDGLLKGPVNGYNRICGKRSTLQVYISNIFDLFISGPMHLKLVLGEYERIPLMMSQV